MLPAGKHFEAVQAAADEIDLLLEIGDDLVPRDADAKPGLDAVPLLKLALHAGIEPDEAAAAALLGRVHGDVGAAQERVHRSAIGIRSGDADRAADVDVHTGKIERPAEASHDLLGRPVDGARRIGIEGEGGGELVSAQTSGDGTLGKRLGDGLGGGPEEIVAGEVPVNVVDRLEPVQVDDQHRDRAALSRRTKQLLDGIGEGSAVEEAGQRIGGRKRLRALLGGGCARSLPSWRHATCASHRWSARC
jgi:hypothetical protein